MTSGSAKGRAGQAGVPPGQNGGPATRGRTGADTAAGHFRITHERPALAR